MFTDKRLTSAYNNAELEYFDKHSKYIFFSDIHRGDDSVSDEFARNQIVLLHALDSYYNKGYTYVEIGDGDELWEYRDFKHIRMAHSDIFTVLKKFHRKRRFKMIYGNHNIYLKNKRYVKKHYYRYYDEYGQEVDYLLPWLTPQESLILKHKDSGQELLIVHGHQGDLMNDQLWPISMLALRYFWRYLHVVGFRNASSPARNIYKTHKIERNYRKWIYRHKKTLICGHTHRPRFPRPGHLPYFNTGCCVHSKGITGIEIADGSIQMVDWRTKASKDGSMKIEKTIVGGPQPLSRYY